jgi:hypothetical protein
MGCRKGRLYFNCLGVALVAFWLVMMGSLVRGRHFQNSEATADRTPTAAAIHSVQREWREIFLKDKKVGYATHMIRPFDGGYFIQEEILLKLNVMGFGSGLYSSTQCRVNSEFLLESFNLIMISGAVRSHISGRVEGDVLVVETGRKGDQRLQRIPLTEPPVIGASMSQFFKSRELHVGQIFRLPLFDPSAMAQKEMIVTVISKERLKVQKHTYNAFRLEAEMWGKKLRFWLDEEGTTLKEEGFMGLTTVLSSAAKAPEGLDQMDGTDLYEMVAIQPDRPLPDPTRLAYLKLDVEGMDRADFPRDALSSARQKLQDNVLEISREEVPSHGSYSLPHSAFAPELAVFLETEFNIESDDPEITAKVDEIIGEEKNPVWAARRLMHWVFRNMEKRPVLAVPSAREALRTRIGDCNEHATLLTALLRASGIPARLSIGLVYTRQKFYYHAWTEAYLGEWVSMDATLNQMPVDASHIKLVEGNLDKQLEIAGLLGELKFKVIDYRHD